MSIIYFILKVFLFLITFAVENFNATGSSLNNISDGDVSPLTSAINNNINYNTLKESMDTQSVKSFRHRLNESVSTTFTDLQCCEGNLDDEVLDIDTSDSIKMTDIAKPVEDTSSRDALQPSDHSADQHNHFDTHFSIRAFILLFALSTHALFEGLAIGFQTSASALRSLIVAVVIHKMALAFSFGISLVNNQ